MDEQNTNLSPITRDCTNFKNYLQDKLNVSDFKDFICTYTFSLEEIEALKAAAAKINQTPVSLRLYYGCDVGGTNHKLYMSLLNNQGEVIVDSGDFSPNDGQEAGTNLNRVRSVLPESSVNMVAFERKCPPGGTSSDRLISSLFV